MTGRKEPYRAVFRNGLRKAKNAKLRKDRKQRWTALNLSDKDKIADTYVHRDPWTWKRKPRRTDSLGV